MAKPAVYDEFQLDIYRDEEGNLLAYIWPGGYPVVYQNIYGDILCPSCARTFDDPAEHDDRATFAGGPYWEGPPVECDECGVLIESAYGDPDAEEEE